jgi:molybdenum cofactor biosynthesis enzyme
LKKKNDGGKKKKNIEVEKGMARAEAEEKDAAELEVKQKEHTTREAVARATIEQAEKETK